MDERGFRAEKADALKQFDVQVAVKAADEEENIRLLVVEGLRSEKDRLLQLGDADEGVAEKFDLELAVRVGDGDAEINGG